MGDPMSEDLGFARPCPRYNKKRAAAEFLRVHGAIFDGLALLFVEIG
jgi:hypothetical protein